MGDFSQKTIGYGSKVSKVRGPDGSTVDHNSEELECLRFLVFRFNAGGGPEFKQTTAVNPQFHIQIPRSNMGKCHMVVSVTQEYETNPRVQTVAGKKRRGSVPGSGTKGFHWRHGSSNSSAGQSGEVLQAIGFAVYEVPPNITRLTSSFCAEQKPIDVTTHSIARETATFFTLPPGNYVVVPQTAEPNKECKFLLRIFTDEQTNIWEVNEDNMVFRPVSISHFEDGLADAVNILKFLL